MPKKKKDPKRWQDVIIESPHAELTKQEVFDYYSTKKIQRAILDAAGNRETLVRQSFTPEYMVLRRKGPEGNLIRLTPKQFERWKNIRTTEFHPTFGKRVKELLVDIDPQEGVSWDRAQRLTETIAKTLQSEDDIKKVHVQYSGGRGFYVRGDLERNMDTKRARERMRNILNNLVQRPDVTFGVAEPGQIRLDLTPFKHRGSVRAPYSLNAATGLVAAPVKLEDLGTLKKTDFTIDNILQGSNKKTAATLRTELLPHQIRVLEKLEHKPGLVVAHGTGSGKTLTSLAALLQANTPGLALVPASLRSNYLKELEKHVKGKFPIDIETQQRATLRRDVPKTPFLIVDEAHRVRNLTSKLRDILQKTEADKRLLLTASPVYNRPSDIAPLVNIAAGSNVLPTGVEFEKKYIQKPDKGLLAAWFGSGPKRNILKNTAALKPILQEWVDYHPSGGGDFPASSEERIQVEMSPRQTALHESALGRLSWAARQKLKAGLPPNKKDLAALNRFQSQARQIGGSEQKFVAGEETAEVSPKVRKATELLLKQHAGSKRHKAIVYSNYLATLGDYANQLEQEKVPYGVISGKQSKKERDTLVSQYNKGKLKTLLVSSAGGEGLDLKGTRLVQVLEPHWNDEKLQQVIGRAIRHGSHAGLPEKERHVLVQRFETYPQPGWWDRLRSKQPVGIEHILSQISEDKKLLNEELLGLLKQSAAKNEFAPGIPKSRKIHKLPTVKKQEPEWMLAIQEHIAKRAGKHYDLRLVQPLTDKAHSWAIPKARLPNMKDKMLLAIQQPTHKRDYALHFTGTLPEGYGAGTVTMPMKEKTTVLYSDKDRIGFQLKDGDQYAMFRTKGKNWGIKKVAALETELERLLKRAENETEKKKKKRSTAFIREKMR